MAKLSDIVGGLLRDLSQSHAVADSHTRQILETYKKDPVLAQFPVPRLTIRQATLRLKFLVKDQSAPPEDDDPEEYRAIWAKALQERIMPRVLEKLDKLDNKAVVATLAGRLSQPEVERAVTFTRLLDGTQRAALQKETVELLAREFRALPKSVQRYLPKEDQILKVATEVVALEIPEIQRAAKKLQEVRGAALARIDVTVNAEDLRQAPESQVSEIELTVGLEEIQRGGN
ncbi:MAG: hypothetical protein HZB24_04930 [Desulfobacterales bacterium]|nr:hypothetical protein [Desulfobacterales bacterium]